ncbi:diacylglycerol kinase family protein [Patescibacteria group bacterium]|nr:diacylglycerol kinase family protein [Patescibacteria group bacterium]
MKKLLKLFKPNDPIRQFKSFKYAFEGLFHAILSEPNFRIQILIVTLSVILGKIYAITRTEWLQLANSLGLLLTVEIINTAIEEIMDQLIKHHDNGVKIIKDLSAAAVLITSFVVLSNLYIIFWHRIFT